MMNARLMWAIVSNLLEEAARRGQLELELDEKSGGYIVLGTKA